MSAKHTPGPWRVVVGVSAPFVDAAKRTIRPHYVINQEPPHDAPQVVTEAEAHANARLIAAAPTMADLLRDAVRILPRDDETVAGFLDDARDLLADLGIAAGNAHRSAR